MHEFALAPVLSALATGGARISGVMVFVPFLGSSSVPAQIKAGLTLSLTALLYPVFSVPVHVAGMSEWVGVLCGELVIGFLLGLTVNFVLDAAQFAGQIAGIQMGFSLVNLLDPQTQVDTPVLSIFHQLIALLVFLHLNVHHWLLRGLASSFSYLPPGAGLRPLLHLDLLRAAGGIFLAGAQMGAPVVAATILADIALGFLGKASPQLPVLFVGLSVKNLLGFVVLIGGMSYWPGFLESHFSGAIAQGEHLLRLGVK